MSKNSSIQVEEARRVGKICHNDLLSCKSVIYQCIMLAVPPFRSATLSNGNARLHAAVRIKIPAEVRRGREGVMESSTPAATGATVPVLCHSSVSDLLHIR